MEFLFELLLGSLLIAAIALLSHFFGLKRSDSRQVLGGFGSLLAGYLMLRAIGVEDGAVELLMLASMGLTSVLVLSSYRKMRRSLDDQQYKTQSMLSLYQQFQFRAPLPPMNSWAVSPELGSVITGEILALKPRLIVEAGSGISTVLSAYAAEKNGSGHIISLDSDEHYHFITKRQLEKHGLASRAEVHFAPIVEHRINEKPWKWYDMAALSLDEKSIDLLVVDGPFTKLQQLARFPAIPLLKRYLADGAVVILDDASRHSEQETVALWMKLLPGYEHQYISCERGISVLRPDLPLISGN